MAQLDVEVERAAKSLPLAVRLMTHPGVGAGNIAGLRADPRAGGALRAQQAGGELLGLNPQ